MDGYEERRRKSNSLIRAAIIGSIFGGLFLWVALLLLSSLVWRVVDPHASNAPLHSAVLPVVSLIVCLVIAGILFTYLQWKELQKSPPTE